MPDITPDQIRAAAEADAQAQARAAQVRQEFNDLVWQAQSEGMLISEISRCVDHLSRQRLYTFLERESAKRNEETFIAQARSWAKERGFPASEYGNLDFDIRRQFRAWRDSQVTH